jgi:hypothetical protein
MFFFKRIRSVNHISVDLLTVGVRNWVSPLLWYIFHDDSEQVLIFIYSKKKVLIFIFFFQKEII